MMPTEYFTFRVPNPLKPGRTYLTRYKLTVQEAALRYPGAVPEPGSKEVRQIGGNIDGTFAQSLSVSLGKKKG